MLLDDELEQSRARRWVKPTLLIITATVLGAACTALVMGMLKDAGPTKKKSVQQISVLRPPPPPPPPKPEEKPPEPELKKEEVKIPEEKPDPEPQQAEQPPAGEQLGVDAQGSGTGDGFGLVGKPGGKDVTTIGGDRFGWYAGVLRGQIQKALARNDQLRGAEFKVIVRIWVEADGRVRRAELADSTGDADKDKRIRLALADVPVLNEPPPTDMPQPIRFRLSSTF